MSRIAHVCILAAVVVLMQFGKFNLIEKIGEGALGEIFFAQNLSSNSYSPSRELVVKKVHTRLTQEPDFVQQFQLAAEQGSFLNHHNIAQTFETGIIDGHHFVAQEYVDGLSLEDILARHEQRLQAIPIEITLEIVLQVCEALTYAYWARDDRGRQLHMVHRNLKPTNIMINKHGVVKVVDFGLVNAGQNMGSGQGSLVMRMAAYMSPEQAKGEEIDNRSDIFSLGAVFYELLTLKPLFCMDNPLQTLRMVQEGQVDEQLRELARHPVGQGLLPLLKSMLGASPWDRPTEAKQLIPHLRQVLGRLSQQIYLPNWIQEEMAAIPRTRRTLPASDSFSPQPAPAAAPRPGAPAPGPSAQPAFGGASAGQGIPPAAPLPAQSPSPPAPGIQDLLRGPNRRYVMFGAGILIAMFFGLLATFALTSKPEAAPQPELIIGKLRVSSSPPGAQVFVQGGVVPRATPFEIEVKTPSGLVDLVAQLDGYQTANAQVQLLPGSVTPYNFVMQATEEEKATLEVMLYPPEASLFLDGSPVEGSMPYQVELSANKAHVLKVSHPGYLDKEESITVPPQVFKQVKIALDLVPAEPAASPSP